MVNSLGSLLLLSLLLEICTLSIIATDSCPGSCDQGQQPSEFCTNPLLCYTCPQKTFSNRNLRFGEKCRKRKTCLEDNMITVDEGDLTHDATCGCVEGYELSNFIHACIKIYPLLTISSESVEKTTTDLAANTNTTDQIPIPSSNKTLLVLAIALPVSTAFLFSIFALLYSYKIWLTRKERTKGLQKALHVVDEKTKREPEVETLNDEMLDGDSGSIGSHEGTALVEDPGYDGEENSSEVTGSQSQVPLWDPNHPKALISFKDDEELMGKMTDKTPKLKQIVKLDVVWAHLKSFGVMTAVNVNRCKKTASTEDDQVERILEFLERGPVWKVHGFFKSLYESGQNHAIDVVLGKDAWKKYQ